MRLRNGAAVGLAFLLVVAVWAVPESVHAASESDVQKVGEQLVCYCGCSGLTAAACTCGTAESMRETIRQQLDAGLSTDEVVQTWVRERGEQILAVPTRQGFNMVGWTLPFVVTGVALLALMMILLRRNRLTVAEVAPEIPPEDRKLLSSIQDAVESLNRPS